jgi:fructokinase
MKPKVIGIGELLWDMLPAGPRMGGAPANFACHAKALGADAAVISRVGADDSGARLLEELSLLEVSSEGVAVDPQNPTGTVEVSLGSDGQACYRIVPGVAWDHMAATPALVSLASGADAICFGSLGQRSASSCEAIRHLVSVTPEHALRVFDVNLREEFFTAEILDESLKLANLCKLSDAELPVIAGMLGLGGDVRGQIHELIARYGLRLVVYTRGHAGSVLTDGKHWCEHPGVPTEVRDTIGAGDSFTCTVVMGLLQGWPLDRISETANTVAAFVCSRDGAVPELPGELRDPFQWSEWESRLSTPDASPESRESITDIVKTMKTLTYQALPIVSALAVAAGFTENLSAAGLLARWSFEEASPPYADLSANAIQLVQDAGTATALTAAGVSGNSTQLNWQPVPGVATRLSAASAALQTNSFGFSFWINPVFLNAGDVILSKEMNAIGGLAGFLRKSWQVQVMGSGKLELIVRGDNRLAGDFFGVLQSTYAFTLQSDTPDWVHVAGGYDAVTGALSLYVDGVADYAAGTPGATHSDGAPLSVGTQRNGNDFIEFSAGAQIDEMQIFDAPLVADEVAYLKFNPARTPADRPVPTLAAHWKLDENAAPYASSASMTADLLQDAGTAAALTESPSLVGNAAVLNWQEVPGVATRLHTSADAIQSDSFSFSFWIAPNFINGEDVLLMKESPEDVLGDPAYSLCSWKLSVLPDGDSNGFSPIQLVVRGSDRANTEPFYGEVTSGAELPLQTSSNDWIHVAGGYDAETGAMALYVNDGLALNSANSRIATPGANNSDGSPLSVGTARNGTDFVGFAVGATIDDIQMYDGLLTPTQAASLFEKPGVTLVIPTGFEITAFSHDKVTGDMQVTFASIDGIGYLVEASTTLGSWSQVKSVTGDGNSTSITVTKAALDAALGAQARPAAFIRVVRP